MSKNTDVTAENSIDNFISNQLKLLLLRDRLTLGEEQANRGEFSDYSLKGLVAELDVKEY